jgi:hypothetical protein
LHRQEVTMNHDCKENTCPFYAEHQNEHARRHAGISKTWGALSPEEKKRIEFRQLVNSFVDTAKKRTAKLVARGGKYLFPHLDLVQTFDPKLATLICNVEDELQKLHDYVTSRTDTKKG